MANAIMSALDTVTGSLAQCFITLDGNRYNMMNMIDFEATMKINKTEVPILGSPNKPNRTTGWSGEWKGKCHFNTSVFRKAMYNYAKTGQVPVFEIQVTNEDKTTRVGRQTVILKDCQFDELVLAKFDADGEYLDEELSGTYDSFEMPEEFTPLQGMR